MSLKGNVKYHNFTTHFRRIFPRREEIAISRDPYQKKKKNRIHGTCFLLGISIHDEPGLVATYCLGEPRLTLPVNGRCLPYLTLTPMYCGSETSFDPSQYKSNSYWGIQAVLWKPDLPCFITSSKLVSGKHRDYLRHGPSNWGIHQFSISIIVCVSIFAGGDREGKTTTLLSFCPSTCLIFPVALQFKLTARMPFDVGQQDEFKLDRIIAIHSFLRSLRRVENFRQFDVGASGGPDCLK